MRTCGRRGRVPSVGCACDGARKGIVLRSSIRPQSSESREREREMLILIEKHYSQEPTRNKVQVNITVFGAKLPPLRSFLNASIIVAACGKLHGAHGAVVPQITVFKTFPSLHPVRSALRRFPSVRIRSSTRALSATQWQCVPGGVTAAVSSSLSVRREGSWHLSRFSKLTPLKSTREIKMATLTTGADAGAGQGAPSRPPVTICSSFDAG